MILYSLKYWDLYVQKRKIHLLYGYISFDIQRDLRFRVMNKSPLSIMLVNQNHRQAKGLFWTGKIVTAETTNNKSLGNNLKQLVLAESKTGDAGIHQAMALCQVGMTPWGNVAMATAISCVTTRMQIACALFASLKFKQTPIMVQNVYVFSAFIVSLNNDLEALIKKKFLLCPTCGYFFSTFKTILFCEPISVHSASMFTIPTVKTAYVFVGPNVKWKWGGPPSKLVENFKTVTVVY